MNARLDLSSPRSGVSPVATNDLLPRSDSGDVVRLSDLLASATFQKAVAVDMPDGGYLFVRNWRGYVALRLNRHRAICYHRRLSKRRLLNIMERAVEHGSSVQVEPVDDVVPSRYKEIPSHLAPDGGSD